MKWHSITTIKPSSFAYIFVTNGHSIGITRYRDITSILQEDTIKRLTMYDDEGLLAEFPSRITHWAYISSFMPKPDEVIRAPEQTD